MKPSTDFTWATVQCPEQETKNASRMPGWTRSVGDPARLHPFATLRAPFPTNSKHPLRFSMGLHCSLELPMFHGLDFRYLKYLEMVAGTRRTLYLRSSMLGIVRGCRPKNVTRGESRARSEWLGFHESFQKTSFWAINSYVRDHHILQFWLVVWLPFFIFPDIGFMSSSQLTHIFQRGGYTTTNQNW